MMNPGPGAEKLDGPDFVSTLFVESKGVAGFIAATEQDRLLCNAAWPEHSAWQQAFLGSARRDDLYLDSH